MELKIGQKVAYFPLRESVKHTLHVVTAVYPKGIPSCKEPMVMLEGKSGVILASHCKAIVSGEVPADGKD